MCPQGWKKKLLDPGEAEEVEAGLKMDKLLETLATSCVQEVY